MKCISRLQDLKLEYNAVLRTFIINVSQINNSNHITGVLDLMCVPHVV